jgi:hypothetical protein
LIWGSEKFWLVLGATAYAIRDFFLSGTYREA